MTQKANFSTAEKANNGEALQALDELKGAIAYHDTKAIDDILETIRSALMSINTNTSNDKVSDNEQALQDLEDIERCIYDLEPKLGKVDKVIKKKLNNIRKALTATNISSQHNNELPTQEALQALEDICEYDQAMPYQVEIIRKFINSVGEDVSCKGNEALQADQWQDFDWQQLETDIANACDEPDWDCSWLIPTIQRWISEQLEPPKKKGE